MPTSREIKGLLQPLLDRRPDLAFVGRTLFFAPITHYLRGVVFVAYWTTSASRVVSFASPLYNGHDDVDFGGQQNKQASFHMERDWKDDLQKTSQNLCDRIESYSLPPIESLVDFSRHRRAPAYFFGYSARRPYPPGYGRQFALDACTKGNFDLAEEVLSESLEGILPEIPEGDMEKFRQDISWLNRATYLLHLLRTDRSRILPLLHEWEAFKVKACKMTKYWKPSPFPCELSR
jgi:hypothetical protein